MSKRTEFGRRISMDKAFDKDGNYILKPYLGPLPRKFHGPRILKNSASAQLFHYTDGFRNTVYSCLYWEQFKWKWNLLPHIIYKKRFGKERITIYIPLILGCLSITVYRLYMKDSHVETY